MNNEKILDISWKTFLKISLIVICFYFIYQIKEIIIWFVFALIISILFNPSIDFLQQRKIPRILGVIFVYFSVIGLFIFIIWLLIPIFSDEFQNFLYGFPEYFEKLSNFFKNVGLKEFEDMSGFLKMFDSMRNNIFNILFAIFGGVLNTIFVITAAIFISIEEKFIDKILFLIFPKRYEKFALDIWERSQKKVSGWFIARLIACLFVAVFTYIVLLIFNVKYPFLLGLLAGIFNFVPYIGPLITGFILFLLTFPIEPLKTIFVIAAFILIQQIENNVLSPILMKKLINIPPILVLFSLVIGAKLWGFLGTLLIVPLSGILFEFIKEFLEERKKRENI
jgi:predicted PurR-regulated permease PerM